MTDAKRHHYVPRVFLERFAEDGSLCVRRRDGKTFMTGATNVAVESGFYDLRLDDGSTSKAVEHILADIEGLIANVFRAIDESGEAPAPGTPNREVLAVYLAVQYTRTPEQRGRVLFPERLARYLAGRELTRDLVAEYLAVEHLRFTPGESEVQAAFDFASVALRDPDVLTAEFAMDMMLRSIEHLVPVLDELEWTIEHERKGRLITSDTPLVIWRPPSARDAFEGVGIGNAHEIRFPLDPAKQFVVSKRRRPPTVRITSDRVVSCNLDMIAGCHQFILGPPRLQRQLFEPDMKPHMPELRFNTGPLYERQPDGTNAYKGEVLHTWVPRR